MRYRILRIIARLNIGGPAIHTILLTDYFNNDEYETLLLTGKEGKDEGNMLYLAEEYNVYPVIIKYLSREISLFKDIISFFYILYYIFRFKPHIIHTHTAKAGFLGRTAGICYNFLKKNKIKLVHTFHGHVFHSYFSNFKTNVFLFLERILAKFTDIIITLTPKQYEEIKNFNIGNGKNLKIVPLGLSLDKFYNINSKSNFLYEKYNISDDSFLIGTVARLVPVKNLKFFIDIAANFKDRDNIKFLIIGDGELRDELHTYAESLKLDNVIFTGFLNNLEDIYAGLDLFVLTSLNEGSPVAIIEALTSGVPVVASDVGGVRDVLSEKFAKFLCNSNDINCFVEKIRYIIENYQLIREEFLRYRDNTYNRFKFNRLAFDLDNIYRSII